MALAPDGKTLAAQWGSSDIKLWDLASGRERLTLKERSRMTFILAYAPDGQTLASGSFHPGDVILWDVLTGKATKTLYPGQRELRSGIRSRREDPGVWRRRRDCQAIERGDRA